MQWQYSDRVGLGVAKRFGCQGNHGVMERNPVPAVAEDSLHFSPQDDAPALPQTPEPLSHLQFVLPKKKMLQKLYQAEGISAEIHPP